VRRTDELQGMAHHQHECHLLAGERQHQDDHYYLYQDGGGVSGGEEEMKKERVAPFFVYAPPEVVDKFTHFTLSHKNVCSNKKKMPFYLHMSKKSSIFAADFERRMDLTACNLVKTMLKLVPQDQTVTCGLFF